MRIRTPLFLLAFSVAALPACAQEQADPPLVGRMEAAAVDSAWVAAVAAVEQFLAEAIRRADELSGSIDRVLSPLPLMTPAEETALRRHLNAAHVARARSLGVRATDDAQVEALVRDGRLVQLEDSTRHWIVRERVSPAYVVPHTRALLEELGERFQRRLAAMGLPPYRIEVTSSLRTAERQAALRRTNPNAAAGVSSHEFGTTVDISYAAFAPPAELPPELLDGVPDVLVPHLQRVAALALESVSARKSRELSRIFGQVLREAQAEGLVLVIYERQQTVFHLTVGRALAGD